MGYLDLMKPSYKGVIAFPYERWEQGLRPNTLKRQVAAFPVVLPHRSLGDISANNLSEGS